MVYKMNFASTDAKLFEMLWVTFQKASQPQSISDLRTAVKIEDKLLAMSEETELPRDRFQCGKCSHVTEVGEAVTIRSLKKDGATVIWSDQEFPKLKTYLESFPKNQGASREYLKLVDKFESARPQDEAEIIKQEAAALAASA